MDKAELIEKLSQALGAAHAAADRLARDTAEAANHPEARPDSDKDTRKIELSYLAAGQAARAADRRSIPSASGLKGTATTDRTLIRHHLHSTITEATWLLFKRSGLS